MQPGNVDKQRAIADWFDAIYKSKGDRYLRPTRAYYVFLEQLQARPGDRLLDVACGLGRLLEAAREYEVTLHGIDLSEVAVQKARLNVPGASIEHGNAEDLPYADEIFDLVTCIGSLERVLNPERVLAEMRRVGTADARDCFLVRNSQTLGWRIRLPLRATGNDGHAGADTLGGWTQLFESNGYQIRSVLPDQYPIHIRQQWQSLFLRPVDFRKAQTGSLDKANEFLFLLGKEH